MKPLGQHILAEFTHCDPNKINDLSFIETEMIAAAKAAKATIVSSSFHYFLPHGVSGVIVIQESHLTIHTWPEYSYAAVDLFTCGPTLDPWEAFKHLRAKLGGTCTTQQFNRGDPSILGRPGTLKNSK